MRINSNILEKFFLIFDKKISEDEKNFLLNGKNFGGLNKNFYSQKYLEKTFKYKKLFSICPFVKGVFIGNTVAFGSANKESDIDLFIIFKNGKIWTGRLILTFIIHIFGLRRYGKKSGDKISGRFCLSFFASEKGAFELEEIQIKKNKAKKNNDIYLAIWTKTLIPVFGEINFFQEFYEKNKWIENYGLSNPGVNFQKNYIENYTNKNILVQDPGVVKNILEKILNFNSIENFIKKILKSRAQNKKNNNPDNFGIIISDDYLKFHDNDIRNKIMKELN